MVLRATARAFLSLVSFGIADQGFFVSYVIHLKTALENSHFPCGSPIRMPFNRRVFLQLASPQCPKQSAPVYRPAALLLHR